MTTKSCARGHDQPGVLHRGVAVTTIWRSGQPYGPKRAASRGIRLRAIRSASRRRAGPARAPDGHADPVDRRGRRRMPPGGERVVAPVLRAGGCRPAAARRARRRRSARRLQPHGPVGHRVRPRLADREVAVQPPAPALEVRERRDRVREQREAAPRPKRSRTSGTRIATSKLTLPRAPGASGAVSRSGTAVQRERGSRRRRRRRSRSARGAAAAAERPVAPQPHLDPLERRAPGLVIASVSRPVQRSPPSLPRSVRS